MKETAKRVALATIVAVGLTLKAFETILGTFFIVTVLDVTLRGKDPAAEDFRPSSSPRKRRRPRRVRR